MSAKTKKQRQTALKLVVLCAFFLVAGCVLPIVALHDGRSTSTATLVILEVISLGALGLVFARLMIKR